MIFPLVYSADAWGCVNTGLCSASSLDNYNKCFCFQNYVPTVFENYTASFEIDKHRIELNMWDTSGKTISSLFLHKLTSRQSTPSPAMVPVPGCDRGRTASRLPSPNFQQTSSLWQIALTFPTSCGCLLFLVFSLWHLLFMIVVFARNFGASHVP